ncbi:zinc finger X-chromosomal protein-like protein [Perkinsela sp. CCAP 1560/4]|nr:zinc finger X-chromosomal protein-like protein [Perkinsela sp. CCAP 1560/4]|eukprot:KNH07112.1 zinc finger X-chromosomal protein-like protein [Perkinsela sp. CCAP 1560/4]
MRSRLCQAAIVGVFTRTSNLGPHQKYGYLSILTFIQQRYTANLQRQGTESSTAIPKFARASTQLIEIEEDEEEDTRTLRKPPMLPSGKCDLCGVQFQNDMELLHHVHTVHLKVTCEYSSSNPKTWVFSKDTLFQCRHCPLTMNNPKTHATLESLLSHINKFHPNKFPRRKCEVATVPGILCPHCPKRFASKELLATHEWADHGKGIDKKPWRCESCMPCGRAFADPIVLMQHILTTHGEESNLEEAQMQMIINKEDALDAQALVKSRTGVFDCYFCDKSVQSLSALAAHIVGKHARLGVNVQPHLFKQCFGSEGFELLACKYDTCKNKFVRMEDKEKHEKRCILKTSPEPKKA